LVCCELLLDQRPPVIRVLMGISTRGRHRRRRRPTWKVKLIKEGVRKAIWERAECLELLNAKNQHRKLSKSKRLTLQGSDYAHALLMLNMTNRWKLPRATGVTWFVEPVRSIHPAGMVTNTKF
jgi:hypothetical protein